MKSTGILRPVDALGRIVIPMEIRDTFDIKSKDCVEIFVQGDKIILKKHVESCIFCSSEENLTTFGEKVVCKSCIKRLARLNEE